MTSSNRTQINTKYNLITSLTLSFCVFSDHHLCFSTVIISVYTLFILSVSVNETPPTVIILTNQRTDGSQTVGVGVAATRARFLISGRGLE